MSPRIQDLDRCPHCKQALARPTPRMCPSCGGSLQKRHLSIGCLSSAPLLLAVAGLLLALGGAPRAPSRAAVVRAAVPPSERSTASDGPSEAVAIAPEAP